MVSLTAVSFRCTFRSLKRVALLSFCALERAGVQPALHTPQESAEYTASGVLVESRSFGTVVCELRPCGAMGSAHERLVQSALSLSGRVLILGCA